MALAPETGDIWFVVTGSLITKELNDYSQEVVTLCPRERQGKQRRLSYHTEKLVLEVDGKHTNASLSWTQDDRLHTISLDISKDGHE